MTTAQQQQQHLLTFPHISAYHLPTPTSPPILLAQGDLVLSLLPASPPDHPKEVLTISITRNGTGTSTGEVDHHEATFLIKEGTPVVKTDTNHEHASYLFAPALPDAHADVGLETFTSTAAGKDLGPNGGELGTPTTTTTLPATLNQLGKIKLVPSHSTSPEQYTETERLASRFQQILETYKCWKEQGWYDIEDELAAVADSDGRAGAGYGTTIADTLGYYGRVVADRIAGLTHGTTTTATASLPTTSSTTTTTTTTGPFSPSTTTAKQTFSSTAHLTHQLSSYTHTASSTLTHAVHDGAAYLGSLAAGVVGTGSSASSSPSASASSAFNEGKEAGERGDVIDLQQSQQGGATSAAGAAVRNFGQAGLETWEEVKLGVVDGVGRAGEIAQSVSQSAHKGIEERYGVEADKVAQDIGQTGTNVGSVVMDGMLATSVIAHGINAGDGVVQGYSQASSAGAAGADAGKK
ncbi:hypothetical protein QFC24_006125 [Naganishia onofrii]|uniref:Uncharacterized protein n=1 Tax=Naganishia onofrii TaxID=1851511 RepID=A0ACC2X3K9_9TREE|nr:hypothetical protein QFC24_006125 [Naganishia onofrii]